MTGVSCICPGSFSCICPGSICEDVIPVGAVEAMVNAGQRDARGLGARLTSVIVEARLLIDRRGVCRHFDVSMPVFAAWGIPVDHVAPGAPTGELLSSPRAMGARTAPAQRWTRIASPTRRLPLRSFEYRPVCSARLVRTRPTMLRAESFVERAAYTLRAPPRGGDWNPQPHKAL